MPTICPISLEIPLVPVLTNESTTYDFKSIANYFLQKNTGHGQPAPVPDPTTKGPITCLIYNRALQQANAELMSNLELSDEEKEKIATEKKEIAELYVTLKARYPNLDILGVDSLEGMKGLIESVQLYYAAELHSINDVNHLLTSADVNPNHVISNDGIAPLHLALMNGHLNVATALLADERVDPNQATTQGSTPLLMAASRGFLPIVIALLAKEGLEPNKATRKFGRAPLHLALMNGHIDVATVLLADERVDPNLADNNDETPLLMAASRGFLPVVIALLAKEELQPNKMTGSFFCRASLHRASEHGHIDVATALLADERVDPNLADSYDKTPLHLALMNGHVDVATAFLADERVDPNLADYYDETPLYMAAVKGFLPVVIALLKKEGLQPNKAKSDDGRAPLHFALMHSHLEVATALLADERVNPNLATNRDVTPLSIAASRGFPSIVTCLLSKPSVIDHCLKKIISSELTKESIIFSTLAEHRDALWTSLQNPASLELSPEEHKSLLKAILDSRQQSNSSVRHPLYELLNTSQQNENALFRPLNTLDAMQAYMDAIYPETTQQSNKLPHHVI